MLHPSFWLLRVLFRLATCHPNGFGPSHRHRRWAIVDSSIRSQDTGSRNRASEISPRFPTRKIPSFEDDQRKRQAFLTAEGHGTGDNRIVAIRKGGFKRTTTHEHDGCDHTSTNAPEPIRTLQLSVLGRE